MLSQILSYLKFGTSTKFQPTYAPYVMFDGKKAHTCNGVVYSEWNYSTDWQGSINYSVLSGILSKLNSPEIYEKGGNLYIDEGKYKYTLPIEVMNFPQIEKPEGLRLIPVDEELYDKIEQALGFINPKDKHHIHVGLTKKGVYATNGETGYRSSIDIEIDEETKSIFITPQIFKAISDGCYLGTKNDNVFVIYNAGFVQFSLGLQKINPNYPFKQIDQVVEFQKETYSKLIEVGSLRDAVDKLSPIMTGEDKPICWIENDKQSCKIRTRSVANGESEVVLDSMMNDIVEFSFDGSILKKLSAEFTLWISPDNNRIIKFCEDDIPTTVAMIIE